MEMVLIALTVLVAALLFRNRSIIRQSNLAQTEIAESKILHRDWQAKITEADDRYQREAQRRSCFEKQLIKARESERLAAENIATLNVRLEEAKRARITVVGQNAELIEQLKAARREIRELKAALEASQADNGQISNEYQYLMAKLRNTEYALKQETSLRTKAVTQRRQARRRSQEETLSRSELERQLSAALADFRRATRDLQKTKREADAHIRALKEELAQVLAAKSELEAQLQAAERDAEINAQTISEMSDQIRALERDLNQLAQEKAEINSKLKQLQGAGGFDPQLKAKLRNAESALAEKDELIAKLREELDAALKHANKTEYQYRIETAANILLGCSGLVTRAKGIKDPEIKRDGIRANKIIRDAQRKSDMFKQAFQEALAASSLNKSFIDDAERETSVRTEIENRVSKIDVDLDYPILSPAVVLKYASQF